MKKTIKIICTSLVLTLMLTLFISCAPAASETPSQSQSSSQSDDASQQQTESPAEVGETATGDAIYSEAANVYFAIPNGTISRYLEFDVPFVEKWLKVYAPNATLHVLDAEGDSQQQLQQIEGAVSAGCDFLIYVAAEEYGATGTLQFLEEEEIPFAALAHTPQGGPCELMVTTPFPSIAQVYLDYIENTILPEANGETVKIACIWGATGALFYDQLTETYHSQFETWENEGLIEIVFESDTTGWSASDSQPVAEQMLTQVGNDVDVILTMNDDLMTGIVAALIEQDMVEDVALLGGVDATIEGLARVQEGWQVADVMMDYEEMGKQLATVCATWLATGEPPTDMTNGFIDNGFMPEGIPAIFVDALEINQDNLQELIIDAGVASQEDIDTVAATLQ